MKIYGWLGVALAAANLALGVGNEIRLDDVRVGVVPPAQPTILPCTFSQPAARPAYGLTVTNAAIFRVSGTEDSIVW